MGKVVIIVNAEIAEKGKIIKRSPVTEKMVTALRKAIASHSRFPITVDVISAAGLWSYKEEANQENIIYCPLTIQFPHWFNFPGQKVYQACREIKERRLWVEQHLPYKTSVDDGGDSGLGDLWLPIILTAKGPLYGELIEEGEMPNFYRQPVDLTDNLRQSLYHLAYQLLESLSAPPSVYLLQFSLRGKEIVFDRLWPFPAAPAIASIGRQKPDLYTCYWLCLSGQPIFDLTIFPTYT
ncbi:conserved hypothetical protein [Gloeothece citriformis PCC 7424]|uniref:Uncharacterized protein n=1 Tax=Gloeothece citriformis (strain PCC 7424) TaxID=65393 RepID=B7KCA8_GLOC7|nr:hypothetical protein [Gloeothece citriformis]ACK70213.1 conserved hypothetical protein [Gloeothece citriformis PCC 7424]